MLIEPYQIIPKILQIWRHFKRLLNEVIPLLLPQTECGHLFCFRQTAVSTTSKPTYHTCIPSEINIYIWYKQMSVNFPETCKILCQLSFICLTNNICNIINGDWELWQHMKHWISLNRVYCKLFESSKICPCTTETHECFIEVIRQTNSTPDSWIITANHHWEVASHQFHCWMVS